MMTKYKDVEQKLDEAMMKAKETQKEHGFNICQSGEEITATNIQEDRDFSSNENKCQETKLGSFHVYPGSKDAASSPTNIPDVQKV